MSHHCSATPLPAVVGEQNLIGRSELVAFPVDDHAADLTVIAEVDRQPFTDRTARGLPVGDDLGPAEETVTVARAAAATAALIGSNRKLSMKIRPFPPVADDTTNSIA